MARKPTRQSAVLAGTATTSVDPHHVDDLIVVRESDAGDNLLFEEMVYKTFGVHAGQLPALQDLLFIGVEPFLNPSRWNALIERSRMSKTATFMHAGILFMFHQGSAVGLERARNTNGDEIETNAFTSRLVHLLERHTPERVRVFNVNRLVRDRDCASALGSALRRAGAKVVTGTNEFDLHSDTDSMVWSLLSNFAASERDGIVERNLLGRIAQARRNEWPNYVDHIPIGYRKEGKTIVPDLSMLEKVSKMLHLMADPIMSSSVLCERLGELGISRPRLRHLYGENATVADALQPKDIRRGVLNWLELYESGVHHVSLPAPNPKAQQFGGRPVLTYEGDPRAYVDLEFKWGVPDGGWAPPHVFAAIRHAQEVDGAFDASNRRSRRPFTGRPPYAHGDDTLLIDANGPRAYRLRKVTYRGLSKQTSGPIGLRDLKSYVLDEATTIATVTAVDLHRSVAEGIVDAVSSSFGVNGDFTNSNYMAPVTGEELMRRTLRLQIAEHTEQVEAARRLALESKSAPTAAAFLADAERLDGLLEAARAELAALEQEGRVEQPSPLAIDRATVIGALTAIARCKNNVPPDVATSIARLIPHLELHPTETRRELRWEATVRLPAVDGRVIDLGPITGVVNMKSSIAQPLNDGRSRIVRNNRFDEILERFAAGQDLATIISEMQIRYTYAERSVSSAMAEGGWPYVASLHLRRALVPQLRRFAMSVAEAKIPAEMSTGRFDAERMTGAVVAADLLPDGWTPAWVTHLFEVYANPRHPHGQPWLSDCSSQAAIDSVVAGADTAMDVLAALGYRYLDSTKLKELIGGLKKPPGFFTRSNRGCCWRRLAVQRTRTA